MKGIHLWVCICIFLFVHSQRLLANKTVLNDSLYTEEYIRGAYIAEPKRALQLLDDAENRKTMPLRIVNELRSLSYRSLYMNKLAYLYARKAYLLDSVSQRAPEHMLKMTVYLAELTNVMSRHSESMKYALSGIRQARELQDREAELRLLFCIGENNWALSSKDKAYDYFNRTIEMLRGSKDMREMMLLSYYYGAEMGYLMTDSRIEEALKLALEREKLLKRIEKLPHVPEGYTDSQYSYLYAKLAYICQVEKKYKQAKEYYQQYLSTKDSHTPDGKINSVPYLTLSGQYEKVIENCQDFKNLMRTQQDTLNIQYLRILKKEVQGYLGMQNYKAAADLRGTILEITDSINNKDRANAALELNAMYDASEKEEHIAEQASQLKIRNISLIFLACVVLLTLFILWRMWRFNNIVRYKNKVLAKFVNEKLAQRDRDERNQLLPEEEINKIIPILSDIEPVVESLEEIEDLPDETDKVSGEEEENQKIFQELNRIVVQDRLYLSPELSREDLAQIVHLNNARFARMIKECTGTNFNGYINELRINYAIKLLKKHPNYTIRAIADEAGFNSTPILYNLFKKKTGMTPYEFKKTQETL